MKDLPKIIVDKQGFLRIKLPSGEMLPEVKLNIENSMSSMYADGRVEMNSRHCYVTVKFLCEHDLK